MSLAESIVDIVTQAARREGFARVRRVSVSVGELAVVLPEALQTAFVAAAHDTLVDGAEMTLQRESGAAWCQTCGSTVTIHDVLDACPNCGGYRLRITGGNGLRVVDMDGED